MSDMTQPHPPTQIVLRLLLSAAAVVVAGMVFMVLAIGFDYDRLHGGKLSYVLMAADFGVLLLTLWAIWWARAGWWQGVWLAVMLPLALVILWMVGLLPCSTRLNCPF